MSRHVFIAAPYALWVLLGFSGCDLAALPAGFYSNGFKHAIKELRIWIRWLLEYAARIPF
jgi:hypothetical protein